MLRSLFSVLVAGTVALLGKHNFFDFKLLNFSKIHKIHIIQNPHLSGVFPGRGTAYLSIQLSQSYYYTCEPVSPKYLVTNPFFYPGLNACFVETRFAAEPSVGHSRT